LKQNTAERWYITIYEHSWGRGRSPEESKKQARKAGGHGTVWYTKVLPEGAKDPYVDDFGGINWGWEDGEPEGYEHKVLRIFRYGRGATKSLRCTSCNSKYEQPCLPTCAHASK
jgi:hypothetical protein